MIKRTHLQAHLVAAVLALGSGLAVAQNSATLSPKIAPSGIAYVTGGVGDARQQAMKDAMKDYNLRLTFAQEQSGAYLANVKVTLDHLAEGKGSTQLLDTTSSGPMLFVKLPAGKYQLRAVTDGQVQARTVNIGQAQAQDLVLHFPAK